MSLNEYPTLDVVRKNKRIADSYKHYRNKVISSINNNSKKGSTSTAVFFSDDEFNDYWLSARTLIWEDLESEGYKIDVGTNRRGNYISISWE